MFPKTGGLGGWAYRRLFRAMIGRRGRNNLITARLLLARGLLTLLHERSKLSLHDLQLLKRGTGLLPFVLCRFLSRNQGRPKQRIVCPFLLLDSFTPNLGQWRSFRLQISDLLAKNGHLLLLFSQHDELFLESRHLQLRSIGTLPLPLEGGLKCENVDSVIDRGACGVP